MTTVDVARLKSVQVTSPPLDASRVEDIRVLGSGRSAGIIIVVPTGNGSGSVDVLLKRSLGGRSTGLGGAYRDAVSSGESWLAKALFPRLLTVLSDRMSGFFAARGHALDSGALNPPGFRILIEIAVRQPWLLTAEIPETRVRTPWLSTEEFHRADRIAELRPIGDGPRVVDNDPPARHRLVTVTDEVH